jgi:hypothetical protein
VTRSISDDQLNRVGVYLLFCDIFLFFFFFSSTLTYPLALSRQDLNMAKELNKGDGGNRFKASMDC